MVLVLYLRQETIVSKQMLRAQLAEGRNDWLQYLPCFVTKVIQQKFVIVE